MIDRDRSSQIHVTSSSYAIQASTNNLNTFEEAAGGEAKGGGGGGGWGWW